MYYHWKAKYAGMTVSEFRWLKVLEAENRRLKQIVAERALDNRTRTERRYREEGLALRRKRRRKGAAGVRVEPPMPQRPNEKWAMDFVHDSTADGSCFRALVVMDEYTRECSAIEVDWSLRERRVTKE